MSGEVMIRFLGTAVGIEGKPSRDLQGRHYGRSRVVSELAGLDWQTDFFFNFPQERM